MLQATESRAQRWARLRFSIIGPLLAAPPGPGELSHKLKALAAQTYIHPTSGQPVRFGASTIERWFYAARDAADPMHILRTRMRSDRGTHPSIEAALQEIIGGQYQSNPDWTYQLLYDNVAVTAKQQTPALPMPSYPSFVRFMHDQGWQRKPSLRRLRRNEAIAMQRKEEREVRSFEMEHVHALWHLDFHVGSIKLMQADGTRAAPHLLCVLDDRSRLVCHAQWYWSETAQCLVHGLTQALQKRGLPRALMTDNGAAMLAEETTRGLTDLAITHDTTMAYSPHQNGKQEVFWAQVEGRLLPMLGDDPHRTLADLNTATQAWVELEYQHKVHRETGATPAARCLAGPTVVRNCPQTNRLRLAFTTQSQRVVRRTDGTVSVEGRRFELPNRLRGMRRLTIRYARWDLRHVWAIDDATGAIVSALYPQDKVANAERVRRTITPSAPAETLPSARPMAPLMTDLLRQYAASGAPPAFLADPETVKHEVVQL